MKVGLLDVEADGFVNQATHVHCAVVKTLGGASRSFRPTQIKEFLAYLDTFDVLIVHNGIGYDWPLLKKLYGYEFKGKKVDSLIMSRLLNPKRLVPFNCPDKSIGPNSIAACGYRVGRGKPEHNDWENFSEEMLHRCSEDVEILELAYNSMLEEAKGKNWRNAFLLSFELFENLQKQEEYGWLVDQEHMRTCIRVLTKWIERIDAVLIPRLPDILEINETKKAGEIGYVKKPFLKSGKYSESVVNWCASSGVSVDDRIVCGPFSRISFRKVDLDSNLETKDYLLSLGWEPLEWNVNEEGTRTSPKLSKDDPFDGLEDRAGKLVAKRVQCRQRRGIIEGLQELIREDGRVASIVNTLAVTGRATHRNIVNIRAAGKSFYGKSMRQIFVADTANGKVLVGTDSDSCQLRMLGGRMGSAEYIQALVSGDKSKGTDLHSLTKRIGEIESRDLAKNVMYCLLFGGGDTKLGKTAKQAGNGKQLREKLYKGFDGLGELVEKLTVEWKATAKKRHNAKFGRIEHYDGTITGLDGRPIKVPSEHQLLVYLLQSDEAIMMTRAYNTTWRILSEKYKYGEDFGIVSWYHDEYTVECRKDIAEDVKSISEEAIAEAGRYYKIACPHIGQ